MSKHPTKQRSRVKQTKTINGKLPVGGGPAISVVRGTTRQRWSRGLTVVSVVFATAALVALSQGVLLLPGLLLMLFAVREFKPPRLLAITDVAVLTYAQSILGNGPTKLVGQGPLIPFPPSTARSVKVVIGEETIVLERKEYTLLVELSNRAVESRPAPTSPAASSLTF